MYTMYRGRGAEGALVPSAPLLHGSWNPSHLLKAPQFLWYERCWGGGKATMRWGGGRATLQLLLKVDVGAVLCALLPSHRAAMSRH